MRIVLITGSRFWRNQDAIMSKLMIEIALANQHNETLLILHGDCESGADRLAETICETHGIHSARVKARWTKFGKGAGPVRNDVMVQLKPDKVLAFHADLSKSKGTKDCVERAKAAGIVYEVIC